jgi:hypothetical protein
LDLHCLPMLRSIPLSISLCISLSALSQVLLVTFPLRDREALIKFLESL